MDWKLFVSLKAGAFLSAREPVMNDAQYRGPKGFDARREERLPASVCIYLVSLQGPRASERTNTENVSYHGARVISKWSWRSGEESIVTPLTGELPIVGRVIYCLPQAGDRFSVGMEFPNRRVKWEEHSGA
jgi:PilZ domain